MQTINIPGDYQYRALNFGRLPQRFWHRNKFYLLNLIGNFSAQDVVLDAGCGSGNVCFALNRQVKKIIGIDSNKEAIKFAKERVLQRKSKNIVFLENNLQKIPFKDGSFDKIILFEVVEHLSVAEYKKILAEMLRLLKPNGRLFLTTPNKRSLWPIIQWSLDAFKLVPSLNEQHVLEFTPNEAAKIITQNGFQIKKRGTMNHFSPLVSLFSRRLAEIIFRFEVTSLKRFGPIIWLVATKP